LLTSSKVEIGNFYYFVIILASLFFFFKSNLYRRGREASLDHSLSNANRNANAAAAAATAAAANNNNNASALRNARGGPVAVRRRSVFHRYEAIFLLSILPFTESVGTFPIHNLKFFN
jgi:hypothetical protein